MTGRSIRDALAAGRRALTAPGSLARAETPDLDAQVLLRHAVGVSRAALFTHPERRLTADEAARYDALIARRRNGEPVAYLTGRREFMGLEFVVDRQVLIPRPETETLVLRAIELLAAAHGRGEAPLAADIGTGSGAIAVSLAARVPGLVVYATDVSAAALDVARHNAARLLGPNRRQVRFVLGALPAGLEARLHLIAANLPYIPSAELPSLPDSVRRFEPRLALDGGPDGLDQYRALLPAAAALLVPGGALLMECDPRQAATLRRLALAALPVVEAAILPDLAGAARVVDVRVDRHRLALARRQ